MHSGRRQSQVCKARERSLDVERDENVLVCWRKDLIKLQETRTNGGSVIVVPVLMISN
jgi:hypothetical protein